MSVTTPLQHNVRNKVLAALPGDEFQQIRTSLVPVRLVAAQVVIEYRHETEHLFFIEEGIVSMIAGASWSNPTFQVAMIGPEGIVGCEALLGTHTGSFTSATVQSPGLAFRMAVQDAARLLPLCPVLQGLSMTRVEALMHQSMQTAAFSAHNKLKDRCVRWLLMAHDRSEGDELMVTHEGMSGLLGVRRSGVTEVASELQSAGLVRVGRGRITIVDRAGLEERLSDASWTVDAVSAEAGNGGGGERSIRS